MTIENGQVKDVDAAWERWNEGPDEDLIFKGMAMKAVNLVIKTLHDSGRLKTWPEQDVLDPADKAMADLLRDEFKNI